MFAKEPLRANMRSQKCYKKLSEEKKNEINILIKKIEIQRYMNSDCLSFWFPPVKLLFIYFLNTLLANIENFLFARSYLSGERNDIRFYVKVTII